MSSPRNLTSLTRRTSGTLMAFALGIGGLIALGPTPAGAQVVPCTPTMFAGTPTGGTFANNPAVFAFGTLDAANCATAQTRTFYLQRQLASGQWTIVTTRTVTDQPGGNPATAQFLPGATCTGSGTTSTWRLVGAGPTGKVSSPSTSIACTP
jgi:hypothetical protein